MHHKELVAHSIEARVLAEWGRTSSNAELASIRLCTTVFKYW